MKDTNINGVILNEDISKRLAKLQNGNAKTLAGYLDDSVSMLLENNHYFSSCNSCHCSYRPMDRQGLQQNGNC